LIVGEKYNTGKVRQYNKAWSNDINVPITWIRDAAHNSNDDQPEQVNRCIKEFLLRITE
jgi:pimeloyl-ACP methyl ester carboxylesterase